MQEIRNARIIKDIELDGQIAFLEGEIVQITSLPTNPTDGLWRYSAFSKRLNRDVEITGADIDSGTQIAEVPRGSFMSGLLLNRLIPSSTELPANTVGNPRALEAILSENRAVLIASIRGAIDAGEAVVQIGGKGSSDKNTICKVVFKSEEAYKAFRKASEKTGAPRRKDGTIIEIVGLEELRPDLKKALGSCVDQALLSSLAKQLADIQEKLEDIENTTHKIEGNLHDEYTREIKTGMTLYRLALDTKDPDARNRYLHSAVEKIIEGIEKTIPAMRREIEESPDPGSSYLELIPGLVRKRRVLEKAERQMTLALESFRYSMQGIQALCEISFLLENPEAVEGISLDFLHDIMDAGIREAVLKSRLIPIEGGFRPEVMFENFFQNYPRLRIELQNVIRQHVQSSEKTPFQIELIPGELGALEVDNG